MTDLYVGKENEFADRERRVVVQGDTEVGVFRVDGAFYAWENNCPHQGGPVCQGKILAKVEEMIAADRTSQGLTFSKDKLHIICPWHGYEYNVKTGRHPGDNNVRLRSYPVKVTDGEVYVVV